MFTEKNIQADVVDVVNGKISKDHAIGVEDLTLLMISRYIDDFKRGGGFVAYCIWSTTRRIAGDFLAKRMRSSEGGIQRQQCHPWFKHVRKGYVVERNKQDTWVPIRQISRGELLSVIERMDLEIETKTEHRDELKKLFKDVFGA